MVWNSLWPDGTKSVKQNTVPGQQNTTYTETSMNNDHYWNIGTDEDGHHKAVQMKQFANSAVGAPSDAPISTGMEGVMYLKSVAGRIEGFYRNVNGIFQFIPSFLTGTVVLSTGGFNDIVVPPDNTFGQIFIWRQGTNKDVSFGSFVKVGGFCQGISPAIDVNGSGSSSAAFNVLYGNGTVANGFIRARVASGASNGTYEYRVMYWGI